MSDDTKPGNFRRMMSLPNSIKPSLAAIREARGLNSDTAAFAAAVETCAKLAGVPADDIPQMVTFWQELKNQRRENGPFYVVLEFKGKPDDPQPPKVSPKY